MLERSNRHGQFWETRSFTRIRNPPTRCIWHETLSSAGHTSPHPQLCRGRTASAGVRSSEPGGRSRATPVLARWRSRCAERGLRQAGCVAARPAAGCSRLQSFICCRPTIPQVWPGMSSAGLEARRAGTNGIHGVRLLLGIERSKGSGEIRFMVGGGRPKADHVGFL